MIRTGGSMKRSNMAPINRTFIDYEELRAVAQVLRSGLLTNKSGSGFNVMKFENAFSKYVGTKFAVAVNSGTAALHSAILAADVGRGDEVLVPSFTFVATAETVALAGAKPVFVDINPETYCIDPEEIPLAVTSRTKAIIPVHLYGLAADMDPIMAVARDHDLVIIEDAAQAHGATRNGKLTGNLGTMGCFSFYGGKNMTTGEGGMITTNSRELFDALRAIRNHGEMREYQSVMLGHNYRMPEIEAAVGLVQLSKLPSFLKLRRKNAVALSEMLGDVEGIRISTTPFGYEHSWYVFTIRILGANSSKRNRVLRKIRGRHVDARVYYPKPIHLFPYYKKHFGSYKLPMTETAARQVLSLPVHPGLTENDLKYIANTVERSLK